MPRRPESVRNPAGVREARGANGLRGRRTVVILRVSLRHGAKQRRARARCGHHRLRSSRRPTQPGRSCALVLRQGGTEYTDQCVWAGRGAGGQDHRQPPQRPDAQLIARSCRTGRRTSSGRTGSGISSFRRCDGPATRPHHACTPDAPCASRAPARVRPCRPVTASATVPRPVHTGQGPTFHTQFPNERTKASFPPWPYAVRGVARHCGR
jgi:hypothetical protein